jgi:hypothetical protein
VEVDIAPVEPVAGFGLEHLDRVAHVPPAGLLASERQVLDSRRLEDRLQGLDGVVVGADPQRVGVARGRVGRIDGERPREVRHRTEVLVPQRDGDLARLADDGTGLDDYLGVVELPSSSSSEGTERRRVVREHAQRLRCLGQHGDIPHTSGGRPDRSPGRRVSDIAILSWHAARN